jgi:hypothetical protein
MIKIAMILLLLSLFSLPGIDARSLFASSSDADLQAMIENKLDLGNPNIEQTAVTMARDYPGEYSVNQVGAIYNSLVQGWSYCGVRELDQRRVWEVLHTRYVFRG